MSEFKSVLQQYLKVLAEYGSAGPMVIKEAKDLESVLKLNELTKVELPADLITYFQIIDGYDSVKEHNYEDESTEIAGGMVAMSILESYNAAKSAGFNGEEDVYWPYGFVPILFNYDADYIVVNCVKGSPTYGAVYDLTEGVGVNLLAYSLTHFLECSAQELTSGFRLFKHDDEDYEYQSITVKGLEDQAKIYGNTPYFQRNRMDEQVIDWI